MSNACSFLGEQQWHRAILVFGSVFLVSSVGIGTFSHVHSQLTAIDSQTFRRLGRLALSLHAVSWCLLLLVWLWSWTGSVCDHYSNLDLSMNVAIQVRNRIDSAWLLMNLFGLAAVSVWPLSWQPKPIVWPWLLTVFCQGCVGALVFAAELRLLIFGEFWASSDICYVFVDGANFATVNLLIVLVLSSTAALYIASHRMMKEMANNERVGTSP